MALGPLPPRRRPLADEASRNSTYLALPPTARRHLPTKTVKPERGNHSAGARIPQWPARDASYTKKLEQEADSTEYELFPYPTANEPAAPIMLCGGYCHNLVVVIN